jgi:hypothetical protein
MSQDEFAAMWRDVHGPLVASFQTTLDVVRYVQIHRDPGGQNLDLAAGEPRGGMQPPFDGIAEYWWKSEDALGNALASEAGRTASEQLIESERRFVDLPASPLWFAHEYPQVATSLRRPVAHLHSGVMRLHFALHHLPRLSVAEAQRYWREVHGPLIRSHSPARGVIAYNQVHRYDSPLASVLTAPRGTVTEAFIGHAESWFDRLATRSGPELDAAIAAAVGDERNFVDWQRSTILVGKELVFIDREWAR